MSVQIRISTLDRATTGLTCTAMSDTTPILLNLPLEMLQHICSFVTPDSLISLRCVCRELYNASYDVFAEVFLKELSCFIPDVSRLKRLNAIASVPHLRRKIEYVYLMMCCFECEGGHYQCAPKENGNIVDTMMKLEGQGLETSSQPTYQHSAFLYMISTLKQLQEPSVQLSMLFCMAPELSCAADVVNDMLRIVAALYCPLTMLLCKDEQIAALDGQFTSGYSGVLDCVLDLQAFHFLTMLDDTLHPTAVSGVRAATHILATSKDLNRLQLKFSGQTHDWSQINAHVLRLSTNLLLANDLSWVVQLILCGITSEQETIREVMLRCMDSVQHIDLTSICLIGAPESWIKTLKWIDDCSELEKLQFNDLSVLDAGLSYSVAFRERSVPSATGNGSESLLLESKATLHADLEAVINDDLIFSEER